MTWLMAAVACALLAVVVGVYVRFWRHADADWSSCRECAADGCGTTRTAVAQTPAERAARRDAARQASQAAARAYVERLQSAQETPACGAAAERAAKRTSE